MGFDEYTSTATVKAEQVTEQRSVITPNGPLAAQPGQWEVRYPDGNVQVVDDEQFAATFEQGAAKEEADVEETYGDAPVNTVPDTEPEPESEPESEAETEPTSTPKAEKTTARAPTKPR